MWHILETGEVHTGLWWGNLRERDHLEHLDRWEDYIKMDPHEVGCGMGRHGLDCCGLG